ECAAEADSCAQVYGVETRSGVAGEDSCDTDAGRRGDSVAAGGVCVASAAADVDCGAGAANCMREYCESAAGSGHGTAHGDVGANGAGGDARKNHSPAVDREPCAFGDGGPGGVGGGLCGYADAAIDGVSGG